MGCAVSRARADLRRSLADLESGRRRLAATKRRMDSVAATAAEDVEAADGAVRRAEAVALSYEEAMERMQSRVRIMEEQVTTLIEANKSLQERWKAETAVQVRRQAAASGRED